MTIRQTSEPQIGQIYMPGVNWLLLSGVVVLVLGFKSSLAMAEANRFSPSGTLLLTAPKQYAAQKLRFIARKRTCVCL